MCTRTLILANAQVLSEDDSFPVPIAAHVVTEEDFHAWESQGGVLPPDVRYVDALPASHTLKLTRQLNNNGGSSVPARGRTPSGGKSRKDVSASDLLGDVGMTLGDAVALAKTQRRELAASGRVANAGQT